jgi:hypothetical protein
MKTIHAVAFAAATLLSTAAFAGTESSHNGLPVNQATIERSVTGGFQALAQSNVAAQDFSVRQTVTDPAHAATSGK